MLLCQHVHIYLKAPHISFACPLLYVVDILLYQPPGSFTLEETEDHIISQTIGSFAFEEAGHQLNQASPTHSNSPKNAEELIDFRVTMEQRSLCDHLGKDTAN